MSAAAIAWGFLAFLGIVAAGAIAVFLADLMRDTDNDWEQK